MVYTISRTVEIVKEDKGSYWREIFVAFVGSIPFITYGIESTSLTSSPHSGNFSTGDAVPWSTTALLVAAAASAPVFCFSANKVGRKVAMFVITLVQAASLIPLFMLNSTNTIILHVLAGISSGGLFTVIPAYIREITSEPTRGFCMMLMVVMTTVGYLSRLVMTLEGRMFLMTALVMLQMVLMTCVLESPSFLSNVGKYKKAKTNMAKLRRLPMDSPSLSKRIERLKAESENAKARGNITLTVFYRNKIWWDALKIGLLLYTTMTLCGSTVFLNQQKTLMQLRVQFDRENTLVLAAMVAGTLISLLCVIVLDRKYILTFGYIVMALSSGVLAVFTQVDLTVASLRWMPVVALAALVLGYGMSWALPNIIMAELFNFELRATMLGILFTYGQIIKLLHVYTFKYLEENVGIYTMLYIYASLNLYGAVYTLFAVPAIRYKSLKEIEKQLKRPVLPA